MPFRKGAIVRQKLPAPIQGTVTGFSVDQETGTTIVIVQWRAPAGDDASRAFSESELELVPPTP